jgi:type IV pilus assembly protein PilW
MTRPSRRRIAGLSLVELMVALTLGLIILAAVGQIFLTSRATYTLGEGLARIQENGRFAMEFLAQDIRMAGYTGCNSTLSGANVGNIVAPAASATTFNPDGIAGYKYACTSACTGALSEWDPDLPSGYFSAGQVVTGTDVVVIQRGSTDGTHLTGNTAPSNANVQIVSTTAIAATIAADDVLMVSDCKNADIFRATNASSGSGKITIAHSSVGNTSNFLTHSYGNDAELMKLETLIYYIGRRDNNASNPPSLFRKELNTGNLVAQELVEGVESMKFKYGEDTDGDGDVDLYRDPGAVANWRKVLTVRVGLLVRSPSTVEQTADTRTYDIAGTTFGPYNDRYRRRTFHSTVQLRNH